MTYSVFPKGRHLLSSRGRELALRCSLQRIIFNKAARERFDNKANAWLLWDKEHQMVAVQPCDDGAAHRVSYSNSNLQCSIACKAFLQATKLAGFYSPTWNEFEKRFEWSINAALRAEGEKGE